MHHVMTKKIFVSYRDFFTPIVEEDFLRGVAAIRNIVVLIWDATASLRIGAQ